MAFIALTCGRSKAQAAPATRSGRCRRLRRGSRRASATQARPTASRSARSELSRISSLELAGLTGRARRAVLPKLDAMAKRDQGRAAWRNSDGAFGRGQCLSEWRTAPILAHLRLEGALGCDLARPIGGVCRHRDPDNFKLRHY